MLVFVVGTGRCGSTPIVDAIARHRDVGFVSNVDDKLGRLDLAGRWNNALHRIGAPRDPRLRPLRDSWGLFERNRLRIAPSEAWNVLDRQVAPIMSTPSRDLLAGDCTPWLRGRLQTFFERRIAAQNKPVFVHHLTGWPRTGFLRAAFEDARIIHVVRDGRAVANSWLQMGWWRGYQGPSAWHLGPLSDADQRIWDESGQSFPVLAGLGWRILIEAFEAARSRVPSEHWLEVRYEDVLDNPRQNVAAMLDFLGLRWDRAYDAQFARCRFETGRVDAFQRDLGTDSVAALERCIGSTLRAYGYATTATSTEHFPANAVA